jgi:hypothetical protein
MPRPFETRYWVDLRKTKPVTRGFPKAEVGSIKGASRAVAMGYVNKVQCIDRERDHVVWTVKRGDKVRGVNIRPVLVFRGDPDQKPARKTKKEGRPA